MKDFDIPANARPKAQFAAHAGSKLPHVNTNTWAKDVQRQLARNEVVSDHYGYWVPRASVPTLPLYGQHVSTGAPALPPIRPYKRTVTHGG